MFIFTDKIYLKQKIYEIMVFVWNDRSTIQLYLTGRLVDNYLYFKAQYI